MIIILNGPPYSGKDTAAEFIHGLVDAYHHKLSRPLKLGLESIYNFTKDEMRYLEEHKDEPISRLNDFSWRESQIKLFQHLESCYGPAILAEIACEYIKKNVMVTHTVISDGGRQIEVDEIIKVFKWNDVGIIRLYREGCTFENDIRQYIYGTKQEEDIDNKYDLELFEAQVKRILVKWKLVNES
jgi:hypothetical protein